MSNQSWFVKTVVWFMVFLMSVGFVALVITPFLGSGSLFGDQSGRGATQELLEESRADVRRDRCTSTPAPTGKRLERCRLALQELGSSYATLAVPEEGATELPAGQARNIERATKAYKAAYELDRTDTDAAAQYASFLRDQGKSNLALPIWTALVKANPEEEDYVLQQAAAYQQQGMTSEAIATYRSFLKKFPETGQKEDIEEAIEQLEAQSAAGGAGGGAPSLEGLNVG